MIEKIVATLDRLLRRGVGKTGIITVHGLRAIRSGRYTHVDIHLVVPEYEQVAKGHDCAERFEELLIDAAGLEGEVHTHIDPCRRKYCAHCTDPACPIRVSPHEEHHPITREEATLAEPLEGDFKNAASYLLAAGMLLPDTLDAAAGAYLDRILEGRPYLRACLIFAVVALFSVWSAYLLGKPKARERFGR